ncbi:aprataxin and PNK-like factor [Ornithodoros turicata]|uniref:Putative aprataxin and pnk-like factor n=1 Tax=Ornithodoros turicata TaxID=34597 RepID=A0A2R5LLU4_9ACAR
MKKVTLRPVMGGQKVVELKTGKTIIGRGPLLECSDKKVSRNHAILEVLQDGEVLITPTHVNPCFYQAQGNGPSKVLKKDKQHTLSSGDSISLLPNNYKYIIEVANSPEDISSSRLGAQDSNGEHDVEEITKDGPDIKPSLPAENGRERSPKPKKVASRKERTLPQWLVDNAKSKPAKKGSIAATPKPTKMRQAKPRYTFSESDNESADEEEYAPTKTAGRSSRRNRGTMQKISLDDFVASDDDEWGNSSEEAKPRPRRRQVDDSGSDWEEENRKKKRVRRYVSSDSDSASDWERASRKRKPPTRARGRRGKKSSSESEVSDEDIPLQSEKRQSKRQAACKYGSKCFRKNAEHKKQFSHNETEDSEQEHSEEGESSEADEKPLCQYGADCYRRNATHLKEFRHPPQRTKCKQNKASNSKGDEYEWRDEEGDSSTRRK